jgi:hypothetical protein
MLKFQLCCYLEIVRLLELDRISKLIMLHFILYCHHIVIVIIVGLLIIITEQINGVLYLSSSQSLNEDNSA